MIIALQTLSGEHLGFILFADGEACDDCVIRSLPKNPALLESKEYVFLSNCQLAGEFKYKFENDGMRLVLHKNEVSLVFKRNNAEERFAEELSGLSIFGLLVQPK